MFLFQTSAVLLILLALAVFIFAPAKHRWLVLLALSTALIGNSSPAALLLAGVLTALGFLGGLALGKSSNRSVRLALLVFFLVSVLAPLVYFKAGRSLIDAGADSTVVARWILPLGLSFYTFQLIAYLVEIYWHRRPVERHAGYFALYALFFSNKFIGPIERPRMLDRLRNLDLPGTTAYSRAVFLVWLGLFQKFAIGDNLRDFIDPVLARPQEFEGLAVAVAVLLSKYQIYCDFAGGSQIAIGLAAMFGIELTENFDRPFAARTIGEFWRRWHISLQTWIREYVFLPLLTTPLARFGVFPILLVTFILFGLWHELRWTFVLYGIIQAVLVWSRPERLFGSARSWYMTALVLVFNYCVLISLPGIIFRARDFKWIWMVWSHIGVSASNWSYFTALGEKPLLFVIALIVAFESWQWSDLRWKLMDCFMKRGWPARLAVGILLLIVLLVCAKIAPGPSFVYEHF